MDLESCVQFDALTNEWYFGIQKEIRDDQNKNNIYTSFLEPTYEVESHKLHILRLISHSTYLLQQLDSYTFNVDASESLINTNSRQLSFSVQFEPAPRNRYQISNPITIVKSDKLTKFSSTLNLHN
ncbi:unnamed protein product [Rotaria socialis]